MGMAEDGGGMVADGIELVESPKSGLRLDGGGVSGFRPQEGKFVGVVLNLLLGANAGGVTTGKTVMEKDGTSTGRGRLQQGCHLARMERIDAGVVVSGKKHYGRIGCAGFDILVGRVLEEISELSFVFR